MATARKKNEDAKAATAAKAQPEPQLGIKLADKITPLRVVKAVGSYFAHRFGVVSESDPSKLVLGSKAANECEGLFLMETARKTINAALAGDVEAVIQLQLGIGALGAAHQAKGQPIPAMIKAAGTILSNVTSEEQAAERKDLEAFKVKDLSELVTTYETAKEIAVS